jgi:hypothetical protein
MAIERDEPRISLNQLTEYLTANSSRHKKIIEQQKRPSDFQVIYYQYAQDAIQNFIVGGLVDENLLIDAIDELHLRQAPSEYEETRILSNVEALESFLEFYDDIDLLELSPDRGPAEQPKLLVGGVSLSVRPEILLSGEHSRYGQCIGALKLYFSKREKAKLTEESGKYPSTILQQYLTTYYTDHKVLPRACRVIDIFGRASFCAPRSYKRIMNEIEVACEEITIWWEKL